MIRRSRILVFFFFASVVLAANVKITTPSPLPDGAVGVPYSFTLKATGGDTPYSWSVTSGAIPPVLWLSSRGVVSGTPTSSGTYRFTVQVRDDDGKRDTQEYSLKINGPPAITTSSPLPAGTIGTAYSQALAATDGLPPYSWSLAGGSLPPGLGLNAAGVIAGTPGRSGTYHFTAEVEDSASQTASQSYSLTVNAALAIATPSPLPPGTAGTGYSQTLTATGGVPPYSWSLTGGSLPPGLALNPAGVVSGTPGTVGSYNFTAEVKDGTSQTASQSYSLTINAPLAIATPSPLPSGTAGVAYSQALSATGGLPPYSWSVSGGSLPPGLTLNPAGVVSGTPGTAGSYNFTAEVKDGTSQTASQSYSLTINAPLAITTPSSLPSGTAGTGYSQTLTATGGVPPYSWSLTGGSLPPGLTLNPAGVVSGTPGTAGSYNFTAEVKDSASQAASQSYSLTINAALAITTPSLTDGTVGKPYQSTLAAAGGTPPLVWSISAGSPPPGISLNSGGLLSGTPNTPGAYSFTVGVADARSQTATRALQLTIAPADLVITSGSKLPDGLMDAPYNQALGATGGAPPYTWSRTGGVLPPGLRLSAAGTIGGTPTGVGTYRFTARVTDSLAQSDTAEVSITVGIRLAIASSSPLDSGALRAPYSYLLSAVGGSPPYSWSLASGALPPGLALNAGTGRINGTPSAAGTFTFSVRVADQFASTDMESLAITIASGLIIATAPQLPAATVGAPYSQTLTATGGGTPYTWSITSGSLPAGLSLAPATGILAGTPASAGSFTFTAQATDTIGRLATRQFSMQVASELVIASAPQLPPAGVGAPYSALLQAAGGHVPYTWSITSGALPAGVVLDPVSGELRGAPTAPGVFVFMVRVVDSVSVSSTKQFTMTASEALALAGDPSLASATVGAPYRQTLPVIGGEPPYRWSVVGGALPPGLTLSDTTGELSGTPEGPGDFSFTVEVADGAQSRSRSGRSLRVSMPELAAVEILGLSDSVSSLEQRSLRLSLLSPYPFVITGRLSLEFEPDAVNPSDDPAIQLSSGGRTGSFSIPANATEAANAPAIQTGTVAGTIRVRATLQSLGTDVTPPDLPVRVVKVPRSAPVIRSVTMSRTATNLEIRVTGFSNTRELVEATFRFSPAPGSTLGTTEVTVPLTDIARTWYQGETSAQYGSQFVLVQPFSVQGDSSAVGAVTVILRNSVGASQPF